MITSLHLLRVLPLLVGGHRQLALENLALRQQLAVYRRTVARPRLRRPDGLFWVGLAKVCTAWRSHLLIVTPDTVLRWQRRRFREHWTHLSAQPTRWSAARERRTPCLDHAHGGGESLVGGAQNPRRAAEAGDQRRRAHISRLLPKRRPPPSQTWRRSLPIMPATSSPSTSSRSPPPACACSSFSSCSLTIVDGSSTLT